jgi:coiled-coil domain-containing protein 6
MGLAKEKDCLKAEREDLRRQVEKLVSDKVRLHQEKITLENTMVRAVHLYIEHRM